MIPADTYEDGYGKSRERFERDTRDHAMTILRDDGMYRHVRFARPDSSFYLYDLVTWPGYLAIVGDCEDYLFCRATDMFEWFVGRGQDGINPHYWSQKLCSDRGRDIARAYSEDALRARVVGWFEDMTGPIDPDAYAREDYFTSLDLTTWQRLSLSRALEADIILSDEDGEGEVGAHRRLRDFEWFYDGSESWDYHPRGTPSVRIEESWEWDLRDYDGWFLWCCWAIRRGIEQYRAATSAEMAA